MPYMAFSPTPTDHFVKAVRHAGNQRQACNAGTLHEVTTRPIVVVVFRETEITIGTETEGPLVIQLVTDKEAATGYGIEHITAAGTRSGGCRIPAEGQVAEKNLGTGANLSPGQIAHTSGVAGNRRRTLCSGG